jgi:hypothetical protein
MDPQQTTFKKYLPSAITLILIGWGGLAATLYFSLPFVWSRWAFFVFINMGLTGMALPVVFYLHRRFPEEPPAEPNVITRQSLWVGVFGSTLAWLQLGRLVSLYVILGLAGGLIAAEYFIRIREKANRRIPQTDDDAS